MIKKTLLDIKTLVAMQLKNKIDLSFLHNKKKAFLRILLSIIGFIALTAVIYVLFYICTLLRFFSFSALFPISVLNLIFTIFLILSIISTSLGLTKTLYFSADNTFLLTLPVGRTSIFVSKLIVYYINDFFKMVLFVLPIMIAFGLVNSLPFYFFIWIIFCVFIVAAIPVACGALISIPLMLITMLFKQNRVVEVLSVVICMVLIALAVVKVISIIPENINIVGNWSTIYWNIQDFLSAFSKILYPFYCLTSMLVGTTVNLGSQVFTSNTKFYLLGTIGIIVAVLLLAFVIARPIFFRMASKPFEYRKKEVKKKYKNFKTPAFISGVKKEALELFRTPSKLYTMLFAALLLPIAILFLNKIFAAMSVRLVGTYMSIVFNILIILLILLSSSSNMAKVFSEEGAAHYLHKTNPQKLYISLLPKLVMQPLVMTISLAVTVAIFGSFSNVTTTNLVILFVMCLCFYIGHLFWSAEFDVMSPTFDQYQTTGQGNSNESKSILIAFLISAIVCAFAYLLINESTQSVYAKICIIAIAFVIYRGYMLFEKIRLYFKQPYGEGR